MNIVINSRVGWRRIGDGVVVFNCENQKIVIWNEVASRLWEMLYKGFDFNALTSWLSCEYSLNLKKARKDVFNFIHEAASMDFIGFNNDYVDKVESEISGNSKDGENVLLAIEMEAIKNLIPFAITFETTHTCNERCIHCYMDRNISALSFQEIKRILEKIALEGCLFVSFTGGEFLTRKDSVEIIECASGMNFVIDILSNGTLINQDIAKTFVKHSVRRVQISLYGATKKTHDSITSLPGSFEKTLKGIEYLKKEGIKVEIAFPLMNVNFKERYLVKDLVESMECLLSPSHIITARNNGSKDTFSLRINDRQLLDFLKDKKLSKLYAGRKPFQTHQFYFGFADLNDAAPCYSGFNSCAITPSGKVLPCNQLLYETGDLKMENFSTIWRSSPQFKYLRSLTIRDLPKCSGCELLKFCARCPGLAMLEGGDLLGPSPENCRVTCVDISLKKGGKQDGKNIRSATRQDERRH